MIGTTSLGMAKLKMPECGALTGPSAHVFLLDLFLPAGECARQTLSFLVLRADKSQIETGPACITSACCVVLPCYEVLPFFSGKQV